jgi:hypothetical protein
LEHVADEAVAGVERLRVDAVDALHARAEVGLHRLDEQVDVVGHEAVREEVPALTRDRAAEQEQVRLPVDVVEEDRLLAVAAGEDMVDRPGFLLARLAWHAT